jgi:hypothetical protein
MNFKNLNDMKQNYIKPVIEVVLMDVELPMALSAAGDNAIGDNGALGNSFRGEWVDFNE